MNPTFEDALHQLTGQHTYDPVVMRKLDKDSRLIIRFGAWAEVGENHYIFLYRDSYGREVTVEGIAFIHVPDNLKQPLQLVSTQDDIDSERQTIFLRAALYFLNNGLENTMALEGKQITVYLGLKKIVDKHKVENTGKGGGLEHFDFDARNRDVTYSRVQLKKPSKRRYDPYGDDYLELLTPKKNAGTAGGKGKKNGRMGLALVLKGDGIYYVELKPLIVPIKKNGDFGAPVAATPAQMEKYHLGDVPPILNEFMDQLHRLDRWRENQASRLDQLERVYAAKLADLLMELPKELAFYRLAFRDKKYRPLKRITFNEIEVSFAPLPNREELKILPALNCADGWRYETGSEYKALAPGENQVYLFFPITDDEFCLAAPEVPETCDHLFQFLETHSIFPVEYFQEVRKALVKLQSPGFSVKQEPLPLYRVELRPVPVLKIHEADHYRFREKCIDIQFDYNTGLQEFKAQHPDKKLVYHDRDDHFEHMCHKLLKADPLLKMEKFYRYWDDDVNEFLFIFKKRSDLHWLTERGGLYLDKGFKIYSESRGRFIGNTAGTVQVEIKTGTKWLEFEPLLKNESSGETFSLGDFDPESGTVTDTSGGLHLVKKEDIERLSRLYRFAEKHGNIFRVPSGNHFLINELYDQRMEEIPQLKDILTAAKKLQDFEKIPAYPLSKNFNGTLREYQGAGFRWLRFLREYGLSGCLADDMGLGKTVQTLALLKTLKDECHLSTSLLVLPVSAVPNWEAETQRFAPGLTFHRHMGSERGKDVQSWRDYDLVITSYATLRNDIEIFKDFQFDTIVLDESQNIKNLTTQVTKAVKVLKGKHRLTLSGTPIENNSMELWSLFDFLMPGFLGTQQWFKKQWALPVEKNKDAAKAEILKKMIYPFILRRKKEEVEKELPEKTEIVESLQMDARQSALYIETAKYYSSKVEEEIDKKGLSGSSFKILEGMLRLRQICLFPRLVDQKYKDVPSAKFDHFTEMLEDILSEGHKVLVFSQFVTVLGFLKKHLDREQVKYVYLDGSVKVKDRGKRVKTFQEDRETGVFLLSLKAGGVAVNLTAADYVIIFDPWWNPAVEAQAIDRSHRIGQTKKVIVYRMVVKDSIEEKMLALQDQKRELVDRLITSETKAFKNLTRADILNLFKVS